MGTNAEAKNKIVKAAKKVVSEQGVHKATLRSIAAEAGISIGTLYYYYPSKNELLYDIVDSHTNESFLMAEAIKSGTINEEVGEKGLINYVMVKAKERVESLEDNRILFYLIQEAIMGNEDIKDNIQKKYQSWHDSINTIVTELLKVPESKTSRATAMIVNAAIDGFMLQKLLAVDENVLKPELEEVGRLLLEGNFEQYADRLTNGKGGN